MALIYGQLESAQLENRTSDYSATVTGRAWYRTDTAVAKIANGSSVLQFLLNDDKIIIGTNGTANNNVRLHRGANAVLQFVPGGNATAEGTLSTSLAQLSSRIENYTDAGKPTFGNAGRAIWVTDLTKIQVDTGAAWTDVSLGVRTALSLFGVAGNSNAAGADIVAATDKTVARRSGTAVGFGKLNQEFDDHSVVSKTANYTATEQDHTILVDGSGGAFAITLHTPTYNQELIIVRTDSTPANAVSITGTVSGDTDWALYTKNETYVLRYSTGLTAWRLVDHKTNTDWVSAGTITVQATTGNPTKGNTQTVDVVYWRRVADSSHFRMYFRQTSATGSAAGSGDYKWVIPSAVGTINTNKVTVYATVEGWGGYFSNAWLVGTSMVGQGTVINNGVVVPFDTNSVRVFQHGNDGNIGAVGSAGYSLAEANVYYALDFIVPMTGWKA